MTNLLKRIIMGAGVIALSLVYSPNTTNKEKNTNLQEYLSKKISTDYLSYQNSRKEADKTIYKINHKIQKGDTFSKIAEWYGTSVHNIINENSEKKARDLQIGDTVQFSIIKKDLEGYLPPVNQENIKKNREYTQKLDAEEFKRLRIQKGHEFLTYMNGINPGEINYNEKQIKENFEKLKPIILKYSQKYGMDHKTIMAICKQESNFNQWSSSNTGSYGACGHTLDTYGGENYMAGIQKWKQKTNPYNVEEHIEETIKRYKNDYKILKSKKLALASYNQGLKKVRKAMIKVATKRGIEINNQNTKEIEQLLKKTGQGNKGYVQEVLNELPKEGRKYPTLVLNQLSWIKKNI